MKPLISILKVANEEITSSAPSDTAKHITKARVTQLSALKCLLAITETVPQFLPPYLSDLLSSSTILCSSLRSTTDNSALTVQVTDTADMLCSALSKNVAARIIIPAASQALQKSILSSDVKLLLRIIDVAVDAATTATVVSQKDNVLLAITKSLQYDGAWEEYSALVGVACNLLSTMVMKVSEIELRRIYQSLRRWCGDICTDDPNKNAQQRFGFWTLSSRLGQELRSIFLPCLDMVTDDMIAELKISLSVLCPPRVSKATKSSKKQKIDHATSTSSSLPSSLSSPSVISMRILQPLLSMLEHCLRADAYQGGLWTRGDNNQKFEQLLDPIGKLLFSQIPSNYPIPDHVNDPYRYIIEGEVPNGGDNAATTGTSSGSVVGCLSALALVGGNEQLWKPLNQVIMEACGNDDNRSEVRRAGLLCLLELIQSLGEEYIVLLPENLPLLSELMEDTNEDVARLARDVVTQAEELLGKSFQDD
jgi:U3 small nucleolar RNA-associated protein 10